MKIGRIFAVPPLLFTWLTLLASGTVDRAQASEQMTPLLLTVQDAPVPFMGSDGRVHLVYELGMTNFSSAEIAVEKVEVVGDGATLQTLDTAAVAGRLQPGGQRDSTGTLARSTQALLFLNVALATGANVPVELSHRISLKVSAAPPGHQEFEESGGKTTVDRRPVALIGPPLRGSRYISADSCCDAVRHTRAALPVNGRVWVAQRYAVDWEQTDAGGQIYTGPREKLESYAIFGQPVLAVADALVVSIIDGEPEQTPGNYPTNIALDKADGNSVILDLGHQRYALYAHMQPGSIKVRSGDKVHLGQVIGLVGDTGNSIVPHLHFQVTDGPSSLSSNGFPYEISEFQITGETAGGTKAFDEAESNGTPLPITPVVPSRPVKGAMPLDQLIISFADR
ncbi:MAG TPA: M23 family metallopeptidase [Acidobacteriaceae bacterium]|nr:M23 family metallopeptidase [Acidobacteriaceae bacterium]